MLYPVVFLRCRERYRALQIGKLANSRRRKRKKKVRSSDTIRNERPSKLDGLWQVLLFSFTGISTNFKALSATAALASLVRRIP